MSQEDFVNLTVKVPKELRSKVKQTADNEDMTMEAFVIAALEQKFERMKQQSTIVIFLSTYEIYVGCC